MRTLTLYRFRSSDEGTLGAILDEAWEPIVLTIELPWVDNKRNLSCIPPGEYNVDYLPRSGSGKYNKTYWIRGVPSRSQVLIHSGNWAGSIKKGYRTHSNGCPLVGTRFGRLGGQMAVLASKIGMNKLRREIGEESFRLTVIDGTEV